MKTAQIIETVNKAGSLEVSRFDPKDYVLRKQVKRLVDAGVLSCTKQKATFKYVANK